MSVMESSSLGFVGGIDKNPIDVCGGDGGGITSRHKLSIDRHPLPFSSVISKINSV